jgi:hypothetical protein
MELLGNGPLGPGGFRHPVDVLKGDACGAAGADNDQPVRATVAPIRWFIARSVAVAQQSPIELGESPRIRRIEHHLPQ